MASKKSDPYLIDKDTSPLTDDEVERLIPAKTFFAQQGLPLPKKRGRPPVDTPKEPVSIRLDKDVIDYFKAKTGHPTGKGWQSEINAALRGIIEV